MQTYNFASKGINTILSALLSFSYIYALTTSLHFKYNPLFILGIVSLCLLVYSIAFINKLSLKISGIVFVTGIALFSINLAVNGLFSDFTSNIYSLIDWTNSYIAGNAHNNIAYQTYITVLLCVLITLFAFIFTVKRFNFFVVLISGVSLFGIQWIYKYFVSYTSLYIFILLVLVYYLKHIFAKKSSAESNDYVDESSFTIFIVPICAFILIISALIPTSTRSLHWSWLDKRVNAVVKHLFNSGSSPSSFEYFSVASTGFGDDNSLGGNVQADNTLVLKVKSPKSDIYLKGSSRDFYTGNSWASTDKTLNALTSSKGNIDLGNDMDIFELKKGALLLTDAEDYLKKYYRPYNINITFENMKTKSLFLPLKTETLDFFLNTSVKVFSDDNNILSSNVSQKKGFKYSPYIYSMKNNDDNLKNMLRRSKRGLYIDFLLKSVPRNETAIVYNNEVDILTVVEDLSRFRNGNSAITSTKIIRGLKYDDLRTLAVHSKEMYEKYLQLPQKLPVRIKNLAQSITTSKTNDYDKVKSIEEYLSKNYVYTLSPGPAPKGQDFVDYFLFNSKKGYCTYYASAMTVLVRSLGIPARYVEGYSLPSDPDFDMVYEVTNKQAHAWVEVYFEGFGWVPFEPTAPFSANFYSNQEISGVYSQAFQNNPSYQEFMKRMGITGKKDYKMPDEDSGDINNVKTPIEQKILFAVVIVIGVILFILLCIMLFNHIRCNYYMRYKIIKMPPKEGVLFLYKFYLKLLNLQGLPIGLGETPLQYADRLPDTIIVERINSKNITFKDITEIFVTARFSPNDISVSNKNDVFEFYDYLLGETKQRLGRFKFFARKYILGKV
ncbi:MAG: transglutaminase-like domain-containing protein [Clostridia bacterium]|nr:transglutaminase-like domain-containing protein [Clostridia bacterium]